MAVTVATIGELRAFISQWRRGGERIGFVPTMGNLHAGHLRLIEHARARAQRVVVSIFVNPLQFDVSEDFANYPRTLERDIQALGAVDLVFTPDSQTMYPEGAAAGSFVEVPGIGDVLEGAHRPGHFRGVATVVSKLFNIVQPDVAVFGEKDYQQLLLVRRLTQELNFPIAIEAAPTVRDADGLALSSRNTRLDPAQRAAASALPRALQGIAERIRGGEVGFDRLEHEAEAQLQQSGLVPDYVAVRDAEDLGAAKSDRPLVVLGAARAGAIRLIDAWRV